MKAYFARQLSYLGKYGDLKFRFIREKVKKIISYVR